ncbi:MAG: hypothetical protein ACI8WM_000190 [Burkholderiaceae bacterium]|jgi:hypothetical protein
MKFKLFSCSNMLTILLEKVRIASRPQQADTELANRSGTLYRSCRVQ